METKFSYLILCLNLFLVSLLQAQKADPQPRDPDYVLPGEVITWEANFETAEVQPTKLFFTAEELPAIRAKIAADATLTKVYDGLKKRIESVQENINKIHYMDIPTDPYLGFKIMDGAAYSYQGRMMHSQVLSLAFVGLVDENEAMIRKAIDMLVSACRDFGPVEIYGSLRIALNVGDMALPVMIGYDWLNPYMSEEERVIVKNRVYEYGKWIFMHSPVQPWGEDIYQREASNWNVVLHAPMGLAALLLGDQPEWKALADRKVSGYLTHSIDMDGAPRESGAYLSLGASAAYDYIAAVKRLHGEDLLAPHREQLSGISRYFAEMLVPTGGASLNISQGDAGPDKIGWFIDLSSYLMDPLGYWVYYRLTGDKGVHGGNGTWGVSGHDMHEAVAPFIILGWDSTIEPKSPQDLDLPLATTFESGHATARTSWDSDAAMLSFKSDEVWGGWSHADDNTFTYYAFGEGILADPGAHYYHVRMHNGILIDGKGQAYIGPGHDVGGEITQFKNEPDMVTLTGDATTAYTTFVTDAPHLDAEKVIRHLCFVREPHPLLIVVDEIAMQDSAEHTYSVLYQYGQRNQPSEVVIDEADQTVFGQTQSKKVKSMTRMLWPRDGLTMQERPDIQNRLSTVEISQTAETGRFVSLIVPSPTEATFPTITSSGDIETGLRIELKFPDGQNLDLLYQDGSFTNRAP